MLWGCPGRVRPVFDAASGEAIPCSGGRGSFVGDLHAHGKDGVRFYIETKVVTSHFTP